MCIDFIDLKNAYPKDSYTLPSIDELIDSASGNKNLSMMESHSGYNQILMHKPNEDNIAFITDRGTFCYRIMSDLKNVGATFQHHVDQVFTHQIGC